MIFVNFKTYPEATGEKALALAHACQRAQAASGIAVRLGVQAIDITPLSQDTDLPIWAQHIDPVETGKATGFTSAYGVHQAGATGVFLNHSEHSLAPEQLEKAVRLAQEEGLEVLIFVKDLAEAERASQLEPDFLALEKPGLVGTGKAMVDSTTEREKIRQFLAAGFSSFLLVGAGVSSTQDVRESIKLGAKGVVVSSKVVLSADPQQALEELAKGFE
jgi:triosephosphate isomerase